MTTQLLATELANLIQESKRKHNDLRQVTFFSIYIMHQICVSRLTACMLRLLKSPWKI